MMIWLVVGYRGRTSLIFFNGRLKHTDNDMYNLVFFIFIIDMKFEKIRKCEPSSRKQELIVVKLNW